ncbi:DUF6463 family protein [Neolewinella antarctica]|uniref:Uncharacterized protein n=1 Tax=Neolewinella antarctica TaxID=442734 RepID=A0ABX0X8X3_9BACT|nr:DUF6463 family protein [Neolewinella antarctica]NJC25627.1 hypothetical protein [Neolewinella antarctica]
MRLTNGKILAIVGVMHSLFGLTPFAFGKQFHGFSSRYFFMISDGLVEFPLLNGQMNYENFAGFWFVYFGLLLVPLGVLLNHIEVRDGQMPESFVWTYLIVVLIGVYMIPFSGMTVIMLPHALYMGYQVKFRNISKV